MGWLLTAHIGSPDVYYSGNAGPYAIDVVIRPPTVVPGIADVTVHVKDSTATAVVVRPVFWRAGTRGSPAGDPAKRMDGSKDTYHGQLWLMSIGAYTIHVTVTGPAGSGTAMVPVTAVATGQLAPGAPMTPEVRRRAMRGALVGMVLLSLVVWGATSWWRSEAERYRRTLFRPMTTHSTVGVSGGVPQLTMEVTDRGWINGATTPLMPDHDKIAHLFLARVDSPFVFAHLHPAMTDRNTFVATLPPLPAGRYRVFNDVVHESGFARTLVDSIVLATAVDSGGLASLSGDDAWSEGEPIRVTSNANVIFHERKLIMYWKGVYPIYVNAPDMIGVGLSENGVRPPEIQPYLGMLGHAVVIRDDGKVFVHLHPTGTSAMATETAFELRDRGDTTAKGRLQLEKARMTGMADSAVRTAEIRFPYAFPDTGHYHVWVQVRFEGKVHTTGFAMKVGP